MFLNSPIDRDTAMELCVSPPNPHHEKHYAWPIDQIAAAAQLLQENKVRRLSLKKVLFSRYAHFNLLFYSIGAHSSSLIEIELVRCYVDTAPGWEREIAITVLQTLGKIPRIKSLRISYSFDVHFNHMLPLLESGVVPRTLIVEPSYYYWAESTQEESRFISLIAADKFPQISSVLFGLEAGARIAKALVNNLSVTSLANARLYAGGPNEDPTDTAATYSTSPDQIETWRGHWRDVEQLLARNEFMQWRTVHYTVASVAIALAPLQLSSWALLNILDWVPPASLRRGDGWDPHALRKLRLVESIVRSYAR